MEGRIIVSLALCVTINQNTPPCFFLVGRLLPLLNTKLKKTTVFGMQGFDEYMNLVLDEAEEVSIKRETRKPLGRILLKGDNITLMHAVRS